MKKSYISILLAILAALVYSINIPLSKLLLDKVDPIFMAGLLYVGAGLGILLLKLLKKILGFNYSKVEEKLNRSDLPYTIGMIILDIMAPIFLMEGLKLTSSANATLLNNFEIVATSLIAYLIFKEKISKKLLISIILIVIGCMILSFTDFSALNFNLGSLLVILASTCWGLENNCTRMISNKDTNDIVIIKGLFSGTFSILLALYNKTQIPNFNLIILALVLGFISYGLSINLYVLAQRELGAAKTSAYYSIAPFLGVFLSFILLNEKPQLNFYIALIFILISTYIMVIDTIKIQHTHVHTHQHTHEHSHGDLVHSHSHTHEHEHLHIHKEDSDVHTHIHDDSEFLQDHNHTH